MTTNVAEQIVGRLEQHGVDTIFGLPGEENLAFIEALAASSIDLIVTRHEQHAAFMAATHGWLTGRPGVCLATLGPGATNLFTRLAHAQLGGMPVVAVVGQKAQRNNDEGSFQVVDLPAAASPLTSWATSVSDPRTAVPVIDAAFDRALRPRPGAVLIERPEDVAAETACRLGLHLTVLVLRDDAYGFIGWHQEEQGRERDAVALDNPDLVALAAAFGATGHRVTVDDDLASVLSAAVDEPGVTVIECPLDYGINELLETDLYREAKDATA